MPLPAPNLTGGGTHEDVLIAVECGGVDAGLDAVQLLEPCKCRLGPCREVADLQRRMILGGGSGEWGEFRLRGVFDFSVSEKICMALTWLPVQQCTAGASLNPDVPPPHLDGNFFGRRHRGLGGRHKDLLILFEVPVCGVVNGRYTPNQAPGSQPTRSHPFTGCTSTHAGSPTLPFQTHLRVVPVGRAFRPPTPSTPSPSRNSTPPSLLRDGRRFRKEREPIIDAFWLPETIDGAERRL